MGDQEFPPNLDYVLLCFLCNLIKLNLFLYCFVILLHSLSSFLHIKSLRVPYVFVSIKSIDCILSSS